jgi:hypothetical protein
MPKKMITSVPWKVAFSIIFFSLALLLATTGQRIRAAENGNRETKATSPVNNSDKGMENSNKWFADPARGWIRMEERAELQKKSGTGISKNRMESPRGKTTAILWEY